jgi:hypothetical protein
VWRALPSVVLIFGATLFPLFFLPASTNGPSNGDNYSVAIDGREKETPNLTMPIYHIVWFSFEQILFLLQLYVYSGTQLPF